MEKIVSFMGAFLKHIVGVLVLCWRRMLRAALIGFGIGVVLVLLVAVVATGQAYPGALALAVALIFGAALAYGVALTVFIEEFLLGVVDLIRLLEGDAKAVAHITATVTEREAGDVGQGLRRLIGLPAPARPTPPAPPTLPALPRYPAAPARPAPRPQSVVGNVVGGLVRDAALSGGAALASAAVARVVASRAQPVANAPTPAAEPTEANAPTTEPTTDMPDPQPPTGEPVRADRLPRIGWTYEHEAIRPTRPAPLPDTLAELADVTVTAHAASTAPTEPEAEPEPLDVAVVASPPPGAEQATPAASVTPAEPLEDAAPLEDERLAEPLALSLPEETPAEEHAASAPTETRAERAPVDAPDAPPLDPVMLTPAPATTPLAAEEPTLDPALLAAAPATTPLHREEPDEELDKEPPLTPAPATTPLAVQPEAATEEPAAEAIYAPAEEPAEEPALAATPDVTSAPEAASEAEPAAEPEAEPEAEPIPPARSAFARVTRPVADLLDSALDTINHVNANTGPRASAPESGLWERLSQALIDRAGGAPSSPFAAPQGRPTTSDTPDATESTERPEADESPQA